MASLFCRARHFSIGSLIPERFRQRTDEMLAAVGIDARNLALPEWYNHRILLKLLSGCADYGARAFPLEVVDRRFSLKIPAGPKRLKLSSRTLKELQGPYPNLRFGVPFCSC